MADTIKIGSFEVSSFKVGSSDCKIYLGDTLLYPQSITVKDYLRFVARENASFTFSTNSIQYSLNSGRTWTSLAANTSTPTIASGETIYWRASGLTPSVSNGIGTFSSSGQFDVEGNVMSMLFGSGFENQTDLTSYGYAFRYLFRYNTKVVNASGMTLPATSLTISCYDGMFRGCTSLVTAPVLSATTLANYCYQYMFYNCSSLTTAPELPATTLANSCYYDMFYGCTNLTTAPELPATTLVSYCYGYMFNSCSSLSAVTCLATSGIDTNNSGNTYYWLSNTASNGTFTRAANASWYCGAIPSTWTVTPAYERTYAWRKAPTSDYVCDTTTYIKYYKEYYSYSDDNGCTWTKVTPTSSRTSSDIIERDSTDCGYTGSTSLSGQPFTIVAKAAGSFKFTKASSGAKFSAMQYSTNSGSSWSAYTSGKAISLSNGAKLMFRFTQTSGSTSGMGAISGSSNYEVEGNVRSLWAGANFTGATTQAYNYQLYSLFPNQTKLISAEKLVLPSTTLKNSCYYRMFYGCTNLTTAPELPAATLTSNCYYEMFRNCSKLTNIRCYATNISASYCTNNWVSGVASSGTFTKAASMSSWTTGANGIPSGWTVKNK